MSWSQAGERKVFGPDLIIEAEEKVKVIQNNLKVAQSRQKSYADKEENLYSSRYVISYICEYLLLEVFNASA